MGKHLPPWIFLFVGLNAFACFSPCVAAGDMPANPAIAERLRGLASLFKDMLWQRGEQAPWEPAPRTNEGYFYMATAEFLESIQLCLAARNENEAHYLDAASAAQSALEETPTAEHIPDYIGGKGSGLGDARYGERERNSQRLIFLLPEAAMLLQTAMHMGATPEIRVRAEALRAKYPPEHLRLCLKDAVFRFYGPFLQTLYPRANPQLCDE